MRRYIWPALAVLSLGAGCAMSTFRTTSDTRTVRTDKPAAAVGEFLHRQARKCWTTGANPLREGIAVSDLSAKPGNQAFGFYALRYSVHTGPDKEPFIFVTVHGEGRGSSVRLAETDFNCGYFSCSRIGFSAHVEQWLKGDLSCPSVSIIFR